MARDELTTVADEGSTYVVRATYYDEDDSAVTPTAVTWSLYNGSGKVVNSRENVTVSTPSTYNDIVLGEDDLRCSGTRDETRVLVVRYTYNSTLGTGLTGKQQVSFPVHNLTGVVGR